jgi:hypothetical protein
MATVESSFTALATLTLTMNSFVLARISEKLVGTNLASFRFSRSCRSTQRLAHKPQLQPSAWRSLLLGCGACSPTAISLRFVKILVATDRAASFGKESLNSMYLGYVFLI